MHYGIEHKGFEKYADKTKDYSPDKNKKNIFER